MVAGRVTTANALLFPVFLSSILLFALHLNIHKSLYWLKFSFLLHRFLQLVSESLISFKLLYSAR